jgi:hypothetical protein
MYGFIAASSSEVTPKVFTTGICNGSKPDAMGSGIPLIAGRTALAELAETLGGIAMRALALGPLLLLLAASPPDEAGGIGRVKSKLGTATVERGTAPIPASVGQELMPGDWLVTGKDGRMAVTFADDTRFAVGSDSRIELKKFEYDPTTQKGSFIAKVERGSIAVVSGRICKSGRDAEQIETPDSELDVNGTRFIVVVRK